MDKQFSTFIHNLDAKEAKLKEDREGLGALWDC